MIDDPLMADRDAGSATRSVQAVLDETNARFERLRHVRGGLPVDAPRALRSSSAGIEYIAAFWPHLVERIAADPDRLGLSIEMTHEGQAHTVRASDICDAFVADPGNIALEGEKIRQGRVLSGLALMQQVLNAATAAFADDLTAMPRRCPLDFLVDVDHYVSLRMLLKLRGESEDRVGGNAPTLVMGGTATALTMCWNLLDRMPAAYRSLSGEALDAATAERIWTDTRELIVRIGGGSLAAFVALASGCAENPSAMLWEHRDELGLERDGDRYVWTMSPGLQARHAETVARVIEDQQGQYVGCAALYARVPALPLAPEWADEVDASREQSAYTELVRWISAVAHKHYFPALAAAA